MSKIAAFVIGTLAGVALAWPYARHEGWNAGAMYMQRALSLSKKSVEEAARETN